jgi:hypothetical protein
VQSRVRVRVRVRVWARMKVAVAMMMGRVMISAEARAPELVEQGDSPGAMACLVQGFFVGITDAVIGLMEKKERSTSPMAMVMWVGGCRCC